MFIYKLLNKHLLLEKPHLNLLIMKRLYTLIFSSLVFFSSVYGQLNADHNSLRAGDIIIKQQVQYKDPGKTGPNCFWDFSQVELINNEYELSYTEAPLIGDSIYLMGYNQYDKRITKKADLIVGTEHNTMYYFYQTFDSLVLLGHENVAVKQENLQPLMNLRFPLNYGEQVSSPYQSKGLYSGAVNIQSEGNITMHADAFGKMILPSGDTISPVLRVKTEQTILDTSEGLISEIENDKGRLLKTYRWYTKGYRYPIFETVECINLNDDSQLFTTAFYFPLQDHLYLDTDPDNLALLDELWDYTEEDQENFTDVDLFNEEQEGLQPRIYPNPVSDILHVEYRLEKDCPVNIIMATIDGKVVKNIYQQQQQAGDQHEEIDCSQLMTGVYLLKIVAGDQTVNGKILKK